MFGQGSLKSKNISILFHFLLKQNKTKTKKYGSFLILSKFGVFVNHKF